MFYMCQVLSWVLGIKRNKYISWPLEGHSGETDK